MQFVHLPEMERLKVALKNLVISGEFWHFEPLCLASAAAEPAMAAENIMDLIGHFILWGETNNAFWLIY